MSGTGTGSAIATSRTQDPGMDCSEYLPVCVLDFSQIAARDPKLMSREVRRLERWIDSIE